MGKLHSWNLSYAKAAELQNTLANQVKHRPLNKEPRLIAGIDCAFTRDGQNIIGCVTVLQYPQLSSVETVYALRRVTFPYIPELLSFREAPVCLAAVRKLKTEPDLFMVDGQGIAHPRRLGLAAHLGLWLDKPTIGCAKSRLIGEYAPPKRKKGRFTLLKDNKETIGAVVRTRTNVKPLFISVGHRCTLDDAVEWTLNCAVKYRLPEPTRIADKNVGKAKNRSEI